MARPRNAKRRGDLRTTEACDAGLMRCYPVSSRVNHVANDDEEYSRPVELVQLQSRLFHRD